MSCAKDVKTAPHELRPYTYRRRYSRSSVLYACCNSLDLPRKFSDKAVL